MNGRRNKLLLMNDSKVVEDFSNNWGTNHADGFIPSFCKHKKKEIALRISNPRQQKFILFSKQ